MRTAAEFYSRIEEQANGCHRWTGAVSAVGYGNVWWRGRYVGAHRVAYELGHGKIPRGSYVCHTCDNRRCVNADHLFLGDQLANMADLRTKRLPPRNSRAKETTQKVWNGRTQKQRREIIEKGSRRKKLRAAVYKRDRGICIDCGLDCGDLDARLARLAKKNHEHLRAATIELERLGFIGVGKWQGTRPFMSTWACDHDVAIEEGGKDELYNCVTRCVACHAVKTGEHASRRARLKRLVGKKQYETMKRLKKIGMA